MRCTSGDSVGKAPNISNSIIASSALLESLLGVVSFVFDDSICFYSLASAVSESSVVSNDRSSGDLLGRTGWILQKYGSGATGRYNFHYISTLPYA